MKNNIENQIKILLRFNNLSIGFNSIESFLLISADDILSIWKSGNDELIKTLDQSAPFWTLTPVPGFPFKVYIVGPNKSLESLIADSYKVEIKDKEIYIKTIIVATLKDDINVELGSDVFSSFYSFKYIGNKKLLFLGDYRNLLFDDISNNYLKSSIKCYIDETFKYMKSRNERYPYISVYATDNESTFLNSYRSKEELNKISDLDKPLLLRNSLTGNGVIIR